MRVYSKQTNFKDDRRLPNSLWRSSGVTSGCVTWLKSWSLAAGVKLGRSRSPCPRWLLLSSALLCLSFLLTRASRSTLASKLSYNLTARSFFPTFFPRLFNTLFSVSWHASCSSLRGSSLVLEAESWSLVDVVMWPAVEEDHVFADRRRSPHLAVTDKAFVAGRTGETSKPDLVEDSSILSVFDCDDRAVRVRNTDFLERLDCSPDDDDALCVSSTSFCSSLFVSLLTFFFSSVKYLTIMCCVFSRSFPLKKSG